MSFVDQTGKVFDHRYFETVEQHQANEYITSECIVLELGARYGTVSCAINQKLLNKRNQVSVEPDSTVWGALEQNRATNGCLFHIVKGAISRKPLTLKATLDKYATYTSTFLIGKRVPTFTLEDIEQQTGLRFDTLVADCEGALESFLDENPKLYGQFRLMMFEMDAPDRCNYKKYARIFNLLVFYKS